MPFPSTAPADLLAALAEALAAVGTHPGPSEIFQRYVDSHASTHARIRRTCDPSQ